VSYQDHHPFPYEELKDDKEVNRSLKRVYRDYNRVLSYQDRHPFPYKELKDDKEFKKSLKVSRDIS